MANEIRYSGLGDLRLTETLAAQVQLLLADRNALGNHPALMYVGDASGTPSLTKKISQLGWLGYDAMSDVAEGASVSNTAFTDSFGSFASRSDARTVSMCLSPSVSARLRMFSVSAGGPPVRTRMIWSTSAQPAPFRL